MSRPRRPFLRQFRRIVLLLILVAIATDLWLQRARTHDWSKREWVAVYPVSGDGAPVSNDYISELDDQAFTDIETFIATQARAHGISAPLPVDVQLRHRIYALPPPPPAANGALHNAWWSLRMRYWAWRVTRDDPDPKTRIRLFVVFHDPDLHSELPHSHGLRELLLGVAHVFASRRLQQSNNVIIAHELLHTLGATDKYDPASNQPVFPDGFAEPGREPLYPQRFAEIMGGRIPLSPDRAEIPPGLRAARVGRQTAAEIGWAK